MAVQKQTLNDENDPAKVGTRYTVGNPHPEFGVDPNIKNEYGHTNYPKWVAHPTKKRVDITSTYLGKDQSVVNKIETDYPEMVLVNNEKEEKALMALGSKPEKTKEPVKEGWDK